MSGESPLKVKTQHALLWNALDKVVLQLVSLAINLILARELLDDTDYGLWGMLAIFVAIANAMTDCGLSSALIRKSVISEKDYNTAFYFNLASSLLLYGILYAAAPAIARFYDEPVLVPLSRVLFLVPILNAVGLVQSTQLAKQIRFSRLTLVNMGSLLFSGVAAIATALYGYGVWALIIQQVVLAGSKSLLLWMLNRWRPKWQFSTESFKEMFFFGTNLTLSGILNVVFLNIYSSFLGKLYKEDVGFYAQAVRWSDMAVFSLAGTIQTATYPVFSAVQTDTQRLLRAYRKTMRFTAFVSLPALLGLVLVSRPLLLCLLTDKWAASIPYMQLLCLAGIFTVFTQVNHNFLKIAGNSRMLLLLEIGKMALVGIVFLLTWHLSPVAIVAGQVLVRVVVYFSNAYFIGRVVGYGWWMQCRDVFPYAAISGAMVVVGYVAGLLVQNIYGQLFLQIAICALFYLGVNKWLHSKILSEVLQRLKKEKREI